MLKCKICGKEFEANKDRHYVARDKSTKGLVNLISSDGVTLYDAFDCPSCGCQIIAQERKKTLIEEFETLEDCYENEVPEHDGCDKCKYVDKTLLEYPCVECKGTTYFGTDEYYKAKDMWEEEDGETHD